MLSINVGNLATRVSLCEDKLSHHSEEFASKLALKPTVHAQAVMGRQLQVGAMHRAMY
jgi:hypothetical protein